MGDAAETGSRRSRRIRWQLVLVIVFALAALAAAAWAYNAVNELSRVQRDSMALREERDAARAKVQDIGMRTLGIITCLEDLLRRRDAVIALQNDIIQTLQPGSTFHGATGDGVEALSEAAELYYDAYAAAFAGRFGEANGLVEQANSRMNDASEHFVVVGPETGRALEMLVDLTPLRRDVADAPACY